MGLAERIARAIFRGLLENSTPEGDRYFVELYARLVGNRFAAPSRDSQRVEAVLQVNEVMFPIAVAVLGFYLTFIITKVALNNAGGENLLKTSLRIIVGMGILVYNVELTFIVFEFVNQMIYALMYLRAEAMVAPNSPLPGYYAIPIAAIDSFQNILFAPFALLITLISVLSIAVSLMLRDIILLSFIATSPILVVMWVYGPEIGVGKKYYGLVTRALVYPIPLCLGLVVIEIVQPGSVGYADINTTATTANGATPAPSSGLLTAGIGGFMGRAITVMGVTYMSLKMSVAGRMAISGMKAGVSAAALAGAGYALGGSAIAAKGLMTKFGGRTGYYMSKAMNDGGGQISGSTRGSDSKSLYQKSDEAVAGDPEERIDDQKIWQKIDFSQGPEDRVAEFNERLESNTDGGLTPRDDKYFDNWYWGPDREPYNIVETDDEHGPGSMPEFRDSTRHATSEEFDEVYLDVISSPDMSLAERANRLNEADSVEKDRTDKYKEALRLVDSNGEIDERRAKTRKDALNRMEHARNIGERTPGDDDFLDYMDSANTFFDHSYDSDDLGSDDDDSGGGFLGLFT